MVVVLCGGVGGARLLDGFQMVLGERGGELCAIVNTADDFEWNGLHVSPDLDTVMYTLAGVAPAEQGWGVDGDSFACLTALGEYYGEDTWFRIGDRDLATHIIRSRELRRGRRLSEVTRDLCQRWGLRTRVLPMSDDPVATQVITPAGRLAFQDYLVRRGARDRVLALAFEGAEAAVPAPGVGEAIEAADLVVIGPSNPFVSIAPILSVAGVRERLAARGGRRFAVSPMIGDRAVKGPLADMLASLGYPVGPLGVAQFYRGLVDVFVVDESDRALAGAIEAFGMEARVASILLRDAESRRRLAEQILEWADEEAG